MIEAILILDQTKSLNVQSKTHVCQFQEAYLYNKIQVLCLNRRYEPKHTETHRGTFKESDDKFVQYRVMKFHSHKSQYALLKLQTSPMFL